jgi:UDPglucose 6-dehydrogenase
VRVSILGAGYVGSVTAACLAELGHEVVLADVDRSRVDAIAEGRSPLYEAGLDDLLARNARTRLRATTNVGSAVRETDLTIVAVGTPSTTDGIDLSGVVEAARAVGAAVRDKSDYHAVVVKSTVVPGTTAGIVRETLEAASGRRCGDGLGLGANPEFLTEGRAVEDFMRPDRLVLGAEDDGTHAVLVELYQPIDARVPRVLTNTRTAEMIKYASNALLATMISFANEISDVATEIGGIDVVDVMKGVHASDYLSPVGPTGERVVAPITSFLEAGCGFGGSCLPKDLRALIAEGARHGREMRVLQAVLDTNQERATEVLRLLESALGDIAERRVAVLGLAFKPGTDDTRETPAVPIVRQLLERGADVVLHDPVVRELPTALAEASVAVEPELERAIEGADALVLVTRWDDYRALPAILADRDPQPVVLDGRRLLAPEDVARYVGIGRG